MSGGPRKYEDKIAFINQKELEANRRFEKVIKESRETREKSRSPSRNGGLNSSQIGWQPGGSLNGINQYSNYQYNNYTTFEPTQANQDGSQQEIYNQQQQQEQQQEQQCQAGSENCLYAPQVQISIDDAGGQQQQHLRVLNQQQVNGYAPTEIYQPIMGGIAAPSMPNISSSSFTESQWSNFNGGGDVFAQSNNQTLSLGHHQQSSEPNINYITDSSARPSCGLAAPTDHQDQISDTTSTATTNWQPDGFASASPLGIQYNRISYNMQSQVQQGGYPILRARSSHFLVDKSGRHDLEAPYAPEHELSKSASADYISPPGASNRLNNNNNQDTSYIQLTSNQHLAESSSPMQSDSDCHSISQYDDVTYDSDNHPYKPSAINNNQLMTNNQFQEFPGGYHCQGCENSNDYTHHHNHQHHQHHQHHHQQQQQHRHQMD